QLRPAIVWFGEPVPMMDAAIAMVEHSDMFLIVGTSLVVYPAASLIEFAPPSAKLYLIDPRVPELPVFVEERMHSITLPASVGVPRLVEELLL
ncbi:MAG: hypothetical protein KDD60_02940, partial [Bdellovibrionales bacterium]|nr:hypothetical protein [Bdellovibrionales bacterium]